MCIRDREYYVDILFHPAAWMLRPDRMSIYNPMYMISRRPPPIETVGTKYAVSDGTRIMEIHHVQDMAYELGDPSYRQGNHGADMLIAYLPKEKLLLNADLYSPPAPGAPPAVSTPGTRTLYRNMLKLKLDVERHVPIHGRVASNEEFLKVAGKID